ncbi:zn-finger in ran binding protein and others domain-containing protein [Ditylenchus destructor]|uniref:Zn-finger in ran binding protein and others domain-containing protein n=1 Tax=Ditylenchus destructor TaxID=166010 RepID=A0AAD4N5K9_9BILA|nr:zn-finger in ran binding protein and others domain-containing protein [Ditylenchus destructor]
MWDCTVCTYRNRHESFKCEICDTRKGTSTRKPRLNPTVVQQQTLVQTIAVQQTLAAQLQKKQRTSDPRSRYSPESTTSIPGTSHSAQQPTTSNVNKFNSQLLKRRPVQFRDAMVVRSAAKKKLITVNGSTFTITEYKARISPRGRKKNNSINNNNHNNFVDHHLTIVDVKILCIICGISEASFATKAFPEII